MKAAPLPGGASIASIDRGLPLGVPQHAQHITASPHRKREPKQKQTLPGGTLASNRQAAGVLQGYF